MAEGARRLGRPRGTTTSSFGAGRREAHDASGFYERFSPPELSDDESVASTDIDDLFIHGDARAMGDEIPPGSVALVVTSPPYFAGKEYELALGRGHVPRSYLDYLAMLESVFRRCVEKLEPGGRVAVNVANLGRRPYRSLSADVIRILQDDLGLLLRGEIIWMKGRGQSGSCAWGSFRSATNPVLRDTTERVIVASKGRFDRAPHPGRRAEKRLPHEDSVTRDEFLEATLDIWEIPTESATRVGHPAPFPVALPQRLIELYTYRGDLILDPFLGSGSTAVAAARTARRCAGYETDAGYIKLAKGRVRAERSQPVAVDGARGAAMSAKALAVEIVEASGFKISHRDRRVSHLGVTVTISAADLAGRPWSFDVTGAFTITPSGLVRTDTLWRCLGRAAVLRAGGVAPVVLLTSHLPPPRSEGDKALRAAGADLFFDAVGMLDEGGRERLAAYAAGDWHRPLPGFWTEAEIARSNQ